MKLFIDTNSFLFLLEEKNSWKKVLEIMNKESYELFTSVLVLNELKYQMLLRIATEKLKTKKKYKIVKEIKNNKKIRDKTLNSFSRFYIKLRKIVNILSLTEKDDVLSNELIKNYGLLPTDAALVATMRNNGINTILTSDSDFEKVKGIEIIKI